MSRPVSQCPQESYAGEPWRRDRSGSTGLRRNGVPAQGDTGVSVWPCSWLTTRLIPEEAWCCLVPSLPRICPVHLQGLSESRNNNSEIWGTWVAEENTTKKPRRGPRRCWGKKKAPSNDSRGAQTARRRGRSRRENWKRQHFRAIMVLNPSGLGLPQPLPFPTPGIWQISEGIFACHTRGGWYWHLMCRGQVCC